jgi:chromosomal replication initiator protein
MEPEDEGRGRPLMSKHSAATGGPHADELQRQWARVRARLREECGAQTFRAWLRTLTLVRRDGEAVVLSVGTKFIRDRVNAQFADRLRAIWAGEAPAVTTVHVVVGQSGDAVELVDEPEPAGLEPIEAVSGNFISDTNLSSGHVMSAPSVSSGVAGESLKGLSAPLDHRFTFDNFITGTPNELAFAAARRVAESETVPFNPLFLYGGVGLGKTHLMHAIAWHIRERHPQRRVLYLSAEKFMYQFIRALRFKDTVAFKELFRSVDVLMIDDVQFISGKDSTQDEFFHTFNALVDQNRQVVISADKSPNDLDGMEDRLKSRLGWGLVADIHPTDYELRLGILQSKAEDLTVPIPSKVLEFLAHKITSNVRELEGALIRISAHAQLVGREITLESTAESLKDLLKANDKRVTIEEIQKRVAAHFNIRVAEMHSARRSRAVARPRQIAMYLSKQLTQRSLPDIGRKFGGRDHTTVMHAVKKVDELRAADRHFDEDVNMLRRMLES